MQSSYVNEQRVFSRKEKPQLLHVAVGVLIVVFFCFLLLSYVHLFLYEAVVQVLSLGQISVVKSWKLEGPEVIINLPNKTQFSAVMTWQRSGLLSVTIFSLLFVFLTFPLKGALCRKVVWLLLGNLVGLVWSFIRWSLLFLVAYHVGATAFNIIDLLTGPVLDFLWIVPIWSIGLSMLVSVEKKKDKWGS